MNTYLNKMKSLISVENIHILEINSNHVQIYGDINGMVDPEVYFEIKNNEGVYRVSQVSRGQEIETVNFKKELYAYLFLGLKVNMSYEDAINPKPNDIDDFFNAKEEEDEIKQIEKIILKYISSRFFCILDLKINSICVLKEEKYVVCFVDNNGNKNIICDDIEDFGTGLEVMCNYAWSLQWIEKLIVNWDINTDSQEFLNAEKRLLNVL